MPVSIATLKVKHKPMDKGKHSNHDVIRDKKGVDLRRVDQEKHKHKDTKISIVVIYSSN